MCLYYRGRGVLVYEEEFRGVNIEIEGGICWVLPPRSYSLY